MTVFYIFANLGSVWLTRRCLEPYLLLHSICSEITHQEASGKSVVLSSETGNGKENLILPLFWTRSDLVDLLKGPQEPSGVLSYTVPWEPLLYFLFLWLRLLMLMMMTEEKKKKPRIEINVPKLELWVAKFSSLRAPGSMQPLIQKR